MLCADLYDEIQSNHTRKAEFRILSPRPKREGVPYGTPSLFVRCGNACLVVQSTTASPHSPPGDRQTSLRFLFVLNLTEYSRITNALTRPSSGFDMG